jgi:hypothetical protein
MIHLIFIAFIISGFISEIDAIRKKETSGTTLLIYAAGSVFFLFWHEPYIGHALIIGLAILSVINFLTEKESPSAHKIFEKIDPYLSLACLTLLSLYYFMKICMSIIV